MRILMINYEYPPIGGGSGNATAHLLQTLSAVPDLSVDLITSGTGSSIEWRRIHPSVRIAFLPVKKADAQYWTAGEIAAWSTRALPFARRLARSGQYDLCHCWSGWPSGVIGFHLRHRLPYIVGLRGSDVPGYSARLRVLDRLVFRWLSRRVWKSAVAVTSLSENLRSLAGSTLAGLSASVIYNGVDCQHFRPAPEEASPFSLLFVGRLIERKGVAELIEGFARLLADSAESRLILAGGGPDRREVDALVQRLGVADQTSILGSVSSDQLPSVYRRASVFVLPSIQEALSNAMLESMASGLPAIVTRTGASELINESGVVIDQPSAGLICEAAASYLSDPELRARHGRQARTIAESFTWERAANEYLEVYRGALGRSTDPQHPGWPG